MVTNEGVDKGLGLGSTLTLEMTFLSTVVALAGCLWNGFLKFSFLIEIISLVPLLSIVLGRFLPKGFFKGFLSFVLGFPFGRFDWG